MSRRHGRDDTVTLVAGIVGMLSAYLIGIATAVAALPLIHR